MVTFQHQTRLQFVLHKQMSNGVHYLVQYTRRSITMIDLKLNQSGPVGSNHGSLACARAHGAGSHTDRPTTATSPRALSDPEDKGHGVGRGGEDKDGDRRRKPPGRPGPAGRGRIPTKLLSRL